MADEIWVVERRIPITNEWVRIQTFSSPQTAKDFAKERAQETHADYRVRRFVAAEKGDEA